MLIFCYDFFNFNVCFVFKLRYFYFVKYIVFFPVLIPRNDSIYFFYIISKFIDNFFVSFILELGFGCGIFRHDINRLCLNILSIDLKFHSLFVYYINKSKIESNIYNIIQSNWTNIFFSFKKFNLLFSNPPYISLHEFKFFFSIEHECKDSLISRNNGFFDLFFLIRMSFASLNDHGYIFLEHGYFQSKRVRQAMYLSGYINIYTFFDSNKINRITIGEI